MNKNELVSAVADKAGLSKSDAGDAVDAVFDAITGALQSNDEVRLVGFGTFSVSRRAASTGRNPQTGQEILLEARKVLTFKPSLVLKNLLNEGQEEGVDAAPAEAAGNDPA